MQTYLADVLCGTDLEALALPPLPGLAVLDLSLAPGLSPGLAAG